MPADHDAPEFEESVARAIVEAAAARYFASRRRRIAPFVAKHFSWRGALRIHRHALGWDMLRAPANLVLEAPNFVLRATGGVARLMGARTAAAALAKASLLFDTDVAREIAWLVQTELLELPCVQPGREERRDALTDEILGDPRFVEMIRHRFAASGAFDGDADFAARLRRAVAFYTDSRSAVAETAANLMMLAAGAASLKQFTPGAMLLGTNLAAVIAQHAAIAAFPLGAGLGGLWYGLFPVAPSPLLVGGITGGLFAATAALAPFIGIVADPLQRRLGLHQRRLHRLVDALERDFKAPGSGRYVSRDQYVARLLGLLDALSGAARIVLH